MEHILCDTCNILIELPLWSNHLKSKKHLHKIIKHCEHCKKDIRQGAWNHHVKSITHIENEVHGQLWKIKCDTCNRYYPEKSYYGHLRSLKHKTNKLKLVLTNPVEI